MNYKSFFYKPFRLMAIVGFVYLLIMLLLNVLTDLNSSVGNRSDNLLLESDIGISADNLKKLLLKIVDGSDKDALENHFGISPFMREIRLLRKQEHEEKILLSRKEQEKKLRKTEGK